jgi:RNA polymerase sigma-70 factor (ECF subfamily)
MSDEPCASAEWIRRVLVEHEGALLRYALRLTGDCETARDVVQETFLRLLHAERGAVDGHVGPWLFRVCRQRALDLVRKEQRMPRSATAEIDVCESRDSSPDEQIERRDDCAGILELLAALSANQQEVVRLKFQAGLSYRQISEVTGLSVTNVGFLLHTAIARLRERAAAAEANGASSRDAASPSPPVPLPSGEKGEGYVGSSLAARTANRSAEGGITNRSAQADPTSARAASKSD